MLYDHMLFAGNSFVARPNGIVVAICFNGEMRLPNQALTMQTGTTRAGGASELPGDFGTTLAASTSYQTYNGGVPGTDPICAMAAANNRYELFCGIFS